MTNHIHVNSIKEAWTKANEIFPTDYEKNDITSKRAGYDVYTSTADTYKYTYTQIDDLGARLEVIVDGESTYIWIDEPAPVETEIFGIKGTTTDGGKTVEIRTASGHVITVESDAVYPETGSTWAFKVNNQYFDNAAHANAYLKRTISEYVTGCRVVMHEKYVPALCGGSVENAARGGCRCPDMQRALCMDCAYREKISAARNGLRLVYAF